MIITWEAVVAIATVVATVFVVLTFIIKKNKELSEIGGRVKRLEDNILQIGEVHSALKLMSREIIEIGGRVNKLEDTFNQMQVVKETLSDIKVSIAVMTESLKKITEICTIINEHDNKIDNIEKRVNTLECVRK